MLLYVIDMSGTSNKGDSSMPDGGSTSVKRQPDAVADFLALRRELELYNPELLDKPSIILANKLDITRKFLRQVLYLYLVSNSFYNNLSFSEEIAIEEITPYGQELWN